MDLITAAASTTAVDQARREIQGLVVPFGLSGMTSAGLFTYGPGQLTWSTDVSRVKAIVEHDPAHSVGFALSLEEVDAAEADRRLVELGREPMGLAGVWGRFKIPPPANPADTRGDIALAEAGDGRRDGFSVGVEMTAETESQARRNRTGKPVKARGQIREVSLVAVPAFDDARVGAAASTDPRHLVVAAWREQTPPPEGSPVMPENDDQATQTPATPAPVQPITPTAPVQPAQPATATPQTSDDGDDGDQGPRVVDSTAGAATRVTNTPPIYRFDGTGPSFVRDAWNAKMQGDPDAAARLAKFSRAMAQGDAGQTMALAAVMTRTGNDEIIPAQYRPNLLVDVVDRGRPLWTRAGVKVTLTDATPFTIPVIGAFDGVGVHTEGTAHVAEGTQALDKRTVTPVAISGAFRVSREMIDAANPAIDRIVTGGMIKDYRRETEALIWAAIVAADAAADALVDTVMELRGQLITFSGANSDIPADFVAASTTAFAALANDVDGDGRPMLPYVGPMNAVGTMRAGYTGAGIDGTEIATSSGVAAGEMVAAHADAILAGEGKLQTFRFDEVEGPGVIKFALWSYACAQVLDATAVERFKIGA
jgi:phage head maturation protease